MEGVADPNTTFALCNVASTIALSRALYLGDGSYCLNEFSCSSSMMTNPKFVNGRKMDERAPITIRYLLG